MIDRMIDDEKFISQIQPRPERHEIAILKRLRRFHFQQETHDYGTFHHHRSN